MRLSTLCEVLPGEPVTNDDLAIRFGLRSDWLDAVTGNSERYFCDPDSPVGVPKTTVDLATAAGAGALDKARLDAAGIDFLILATASPDHLMPASVNLVADRLGINNVPTLQLMSGCAGALQALFTARALLADGMRRGLVIGADSCQKMWPTNPDLSRISPAEMVNLAMFGDGGGAAIVEADDDGPGLVVESMFLRTEGQGRAPAQTVRWYGAEGAPIVAGRRGQSVREPMAEENYKAIETQVPEMAQAILKELVSTTGWALGDVEHVLTPQLNGAMTEKVREYLGVRTDQAVSCVSITGNCGNALPFIQLTRAMERIDSGIGVGGRLLVATVESSKWVKSGMALRHQPAGRAGHDPS